MRSHRFGVNYVPSHRWYFCWNDWHRDEIAADFDAIASLGVDHLRVQLIWSYFQPNPTYVSPAHLARVQELMTLAKERNLDVLLTPLTGWLSGYRFLPPNIEPESIFRNDAVLEQATMYFSAVLASVRGYENFLGFDLGNEINCLAPKLEAGIGDTWGEKITRWLGPQMGGRWIVNGVDHNPLFSGKTFSLRHLATHYDAFCIHAWPLFTGCLIDARLDDPPSVHLAAFLTYLSRYAMAQAHHEKPVWIQEFGCSRLWGNNLARAAYVRQSIRHAVHAGATWFTFWCSHDIDPQYRFEALEYDLGLLTTDNKLKPLAIVYRDLIAEYSQYPIEATPSPDSVLEGIDPSFTPTVLTQLAEDQWLEQNHATSTWQLLERYLANQKA